MDTRAEQKTWHSERNDRDLLDFAMKFSPDRVRIFWPCGCATRSSIVSVKMDAAVTCGSCVSICVCLRVCMRACVHVCVCEQVFACLFLVCVCWCAALSAWLVCEFVG